MARIPLTGSLLYDSTLVVIVVIIGFGIALKGGRPWGYAIALAAIYWAWLLVQYVNRIGGL